MPTSSCCRSRTARIAAAIGCKAGGLAASPDIEQREQMRQPACPVHDQHAAAGSQPQAGLSARETMQTAQRLYEDGYITYMRTDSVTLSQEAHQRRPQSRIDGDYGDDVPQPRSRGSTPTRSKTPRKPTKPSAPPAPR